MVVNLTGPEQQNQKEVCFKGIIVAVFSQVFLQTNEMTATRLPPCLCVFPSVNSQCAWHFSSICPPRGRSGGGEINWRKRINQC